MSFEGKQQCFYGSNNPEHGLATRLIPTLNNRLHHQIPMCEACFEELQPSEFSCIHLDANCQEPECTVEKVMRS